MKFRDMIRALRPHQWLKNVLVSVPAIAAHNLGLKTIGGVLLAFVAYSLCASASYILNDLLDLEYDRSHRSKKNRPIAAGRLTWVEGVTLATCLLAGSLLIALTLPGPFLLILCMYCVLAIAYSVYLKRLLMVDVVVLASLYGVRVVAGGAAVKIRLSEWLIGFCVFLFLSLALVKRVTELRNLSNEACSELAGRGYRIEDLNPLQALASAAGFVSVLVLSLYLNSEEVRVLYRYPEALWGVALILVFWIGRVILITGRGEMHDDPVVFALTDKVSLISALVAAFLLLLAT
jgi:4-hydroxybenzoate polyprenyltransferase